MINHFMEKINFLMFVVAAVVYINNIIDKKSHDFSHFSLLCLAFLPPSRTLIQCWHNIIRCVFNYRQFISSTRNITQGNYFSYQEKLLTNRQFFMYVEKKLNVFMTDTQRERVNKQF